MRGVFFPNSNLLFTVQTRDPAAPVPPPDPAAKGAGFSVFEWGQGIYTGWPVIENAAAALADASPWMLSPGLRCENGRLAPVTEPDWIRFTEQMVSVAKRGYRLVQTKNQEAVSEWTGDLSDACAACHGTYRDVGGRGRRGKPARRQQLRALHPSIMRSGAPFTGLVTTKGAKITKDAKTSIQVRTIRCIPSFRSRTRKLTSRPPLRPVVRR